MSRYTEILQDCQEVEAMMKGVDQLRDVIKASEVKTMSIHQKINAKGNLQNWFKPNSFTRHVAKAIKTAYSGQEDTGRRYYYAQDCKTNYTEPRETDPFEDEQNEIERELRKLDK